MIIGTFGRLGTGKTLSGVIEAYRDYLLGKTIFSNIPLKFSHVPIREPRDFIKIRNGFCLADEIWSLVDNRRSMSKLNDIMTLISIRSDKQGFDIFYTQQYLQVDPRLRFITNYWIEPKTFDKFGRVCSRENRFIPEFLLQKVRDGDWNIFPDRYVQCRRFIDLYDTRDDPYTLRASLTDKAMQEAFDEALKEEPSLESDMKEIKEKAQKSDKGKRREKL
jgi:hypothetical protein